MAVFDRVLKRFREKIRRREYVMTAHAEEEMDDDGLTILDVESSVRLAESLNDSAMCARASGNTWFWEPASTAAPLGSSAS